MNFLVDAQLPKILAEFLHYRGFDAIHTLDLKDKNKTTDRQIIEFAAAENRIVISKDNDFLESYLVKGEPAKLIVVRTGNIPNKELVQLFSTYLDALLMMMKRSNLVEITRHEITEMG